MSKSSSTSTSGIGVLGLLGVAFVILKLTNFIDWSWWYVTMPFWGGFAVLSGGFALWFVGSIAKILIEACWQNFKIWKNK